MKGFLMRQLHLCISLLLTLTMASLPGFADESTATKRQGLRALIERFDDNGNGKLDPPERAAAMAFVKETRRDAGMAPLPQTVFPGTTNLYKLAPERLPLREVDSYMLRDDARDKDIPLRITFPQNDGPYPVVILCHGALGSKDGYTPLAEHWATHGYVVIRPTFGDSISLMNPEEKQAVRSIVDLVNSSRVKLQWDQRPRDVSHVIDSLDALEKNVEGLAGKIDHERIAVAGHSYGAHTTMLLSGMRLFAFGKEMASFRDERIDAFVAISPQGTGASITTQSYKTMTGPMLMITGNNDASPMRGQENKAGPWRKEAFEHCNADDAYLLWIDGAYHGFGGITGTQAFPTAGPVAPDHVFYVKSTALAFFDCYLRDDAGAKQYLQGNQLTRESKGKATLTVKNAK